MSRREMRVALAITEGLCAFARSYSTRRPRKTADAEKAERYAEVVQCPHCGETSCEHVRIVREARKQGKSASKPRELSLFIWDNTRGRFVPKELLHRDFDLPAWRVNQVVSSIKNYIDDICKEAFE